MSLNKPKIESINIGLASPIRIRKWAERILPNGKKIGEVTNSKTVNYKTLKPEIGGLFCEKIFGPVKDFECLCGLKKTKFKTLNLFCPICDVEFTASRIRRYRLGYINLASPVTHTWYLNGQPRFLNIVFDMAIALNKEKLKNLKPIIYGIDSLYLPIFKLIEKNLTPLKNFESLKNRKFSHTFNSTVFFPQILYMYNSKITEIELKSISKNPSHFQLTKPTSILTNCLLKMHTNFIPIKTKKISTKNNDCLTSTIENFSILVLEYQLINSFSKKNTNTLRWQKFKKFQNSKFCIAKQQQQSLNWKITDFSPCLQTWSAKFFTYSEKEKLDAKHLNSSRCAQKFTLNKLQIHCTKQYHFHSFIPIIYFNTKLKNTFFLSFNTKYLFFSKQLTKTICNSYYEYYNFNNSKKVKKRKKRLNKFLKNSIFLCLTKSQKTRIFLFDKKIFLNKKKLKIENKKFQTLIPNSFSLKNKKQKISEKSFGKFIFLQICKNLSFATQNFSKSNWKISGENFSTEKQNFLLKTKISHIYDKKNFLNIISVPNFSLLLPKKSILIKQFFKTFYFFSQKNTYVSHINQSFTNQKFVDQIFFSGNLHKKINLFYGKIVDFSTENLLLNLNNHWLSNYKIFAALPSYIIIKQNKLQTVVNKKEFFSFRYLHYPCFGIKDLKTSNKKTYIIDIKNKKKYLNSLTNLFFNQKNLNINFDNIWEIRRQKILETNQSSAKQNFVFEKAYGLFLKPEKKTKFQESLEILQTSKFCNPKHEGLENSSLKNKFSYRKTKFFAYSAAKFFLPENNPENDFDFAFENIAKNFFKIKKTKIKLNLFFFYTLKKNKFINFNGKLVSTTKMYKHEILNLIHVTGLKKYTKRSFNRNFNKFLLINYNLFIKPKISTLGHIKWYQNTKNFYNSWNLKSQNISIIYNSVKKFNYNANINNLNCLTRHGAHNFFFKIILLSCNQILKQPVFKLRKNSNYSQTQFYISCNIFQLFLYNSIYFSVISQNNVSLNQLNKFFCTNLLPNVYYNSKKTDQGFSYILKFSRYNYIKCVKKDVGRGSPENSKNIIHTLSKQCVNNFSYTVNYTHFLLDNLKSQICCYYPIYSKCIFKFINENKLESKDLWESFCTYMISKNFYMNKYDIKMNVYSNRLENHYLKIKNKTKNKKNVILVSQRKSFDIQKKQKLWLDLNFIIQLCLYSKRRLTISRLRVSKLTIRQTIKMYPYLLLLSKSTNIKKIYNYLISLKKSTKTKTSKSKQKYNCNLHFQFFTVKQTNTKIDTYNKVLLTNTSAIYYWLDSLNVSVLQLFLQTKINCLHSKIKQFRDKSFLYLFEKKILKKIIKVRRKKIRLLQLIYYFKKNKCKPSWLMISILPVLPPTLRPIIQLDGNQTVVSDLNQLYKRVLYRNIRIQKYFKKNKQGDSSEIRFHQRLLQESVDALVDNGKGGTPVACSLSGRPLKSLSQILKGKKGRFRQNLLGKRVDYSGRSVIIVGPNLQLHQCGLPKEMAIELFMPFLVRELRILSIKNSINKKITLIKAKKLIQNKHCIIFKILEKILKNHPILLNRAPTLHRLGIQAFQPKLIEGKAIFLHPLVCSAFNADFDGDQMAVHVPLCVQARAEAWKLMWSRNNLLSPATGEPIVTPSQDMVLGWYYLTTKQSENNFFYNELVSREKKIVAEQLHLHLIGVKNNLIHTSNIVNNIKNINNYFFSFDDVLLAFFQNKLSIHSLIWLKWQAFVETENFNEKPLEIRVDCYGNSIKIYSQFFQYVNNQNKKSSQFILTSVGRIILNKTILENILL